VIKYIILLLCRVFAAVEQPWSHCHSLSWFITRKFIKAKVSIRKPESSSVLIVCIIGYILLALHMIKILGHIRIESFAVINLRGVSTNKKYYKLITY
jgi:hypothetical protein